MKFNNEEVEVIKNSLYTYMTLEDLDDSVIIKDILNKLNNIEGFNDNFNDIMKKGKIDKYNLLDNKILDYLNNIKNNFHFFPDVSISYMSLSKELKVSRQTIQKHIVNNKKINELYKKLKKRLNNRL